MKLRLFLPVFGLAVLGVTSPAQQPNSRQAMIRGGGNPNEGKCTIEVLVDGTAQVEIRGGSAQLIDLKGAPPQWRRFECSAPMPQNPDGFRFAGVQGRGRQQLVREPRNGSPAVVEIDDPEGGADGYVFDIVWGRPGGYSEDRNARGPQDYGRPGRNFSVDQAIASCQDNIRQQASDRFRTNNVQFRQTTIDDNRGDWVIGTVEVRAPRQPDQLMRFSCSVDFGAGRVRSASMEPIYSPGERRFDGPDQAPRRENARALENCERAAQQRVVSQGFDHVTLGTSRFDTDRGPRVLGDLRAYGRYGSQSFRFSCSVDPGDGDVRNVDVSPRDEGR